MPGLPNLVVLQSIELDPSTLTLSDGKTTSWTHVCKPIKAAKRGDREFDITLNHLNQMVENSKRTPTQIPFDYNHLSLGAANADQAIAAGWVQDLKVENSNLYGLVDWTEKAAEHIRRKEFRYVSPTINFAATDEHGAPIGASLISAALTIYPFLKGMEPVALSDLYAQRVVLADLSIDERRARLRDAISSKYPLDYAWLVDVFDDYIIFERGSKKYRIDYKFGDNFSVEFVGDPKEVVPQYEVIAATALPSGVAMSASEQNQDIVKLTEQIATLSTAVNDLKARSDKFEGDATKERERADALQLQLNTREAEAAVDQLVRQRKVKVDDKPKWVKTYLTNKELFVELSATLVGNSVIKLNEEHGTNAGDADLEDRTTEDAKEDPVALMDQKIKAYMKDNNVKYDVALRQVSIDNKELVERYRGAFTITAQVQ